VRRSDPKMLEEQIQCRLAAIFAADVAGYAV
jgi:hypothetical protein